MYNVNLQEEAIVQLRTIIAASDVVGNVARLESDRFQVTLSYMQELVWADIPMLILMHDRNRSSLSKNSKLRVIT